MVLPFFSPETIHDGLRPRPDQTIAALSGLRYLGGVFDLGRGRALLCPPKLLMTDRT